MSDCKQCEILKASNGELQEAINQWVESSRNIGTNIKADHDEIAALEKRLRLKQAECDRARESARVCDERAKDAGRALKLALKDLEVSNDEHKRLSDAVTEYLDFIGCTESGDMPEIIRGMIK